MSAQTRQPGSGDVATTAAAAGAPPVVPVLQLSATEKKHSRKSLGKKLLRALMRENPPPKHPPPSSRNASPALSIESPRTARSALTMGELAQRPLTPRTRGPGSVALSPRERKESWKAMGLPGIADTYDKPSEEKRTHRVRKGSISHSDERIRTPQLVRVPPSRTTRRASRETSANKAAAAAETGATAAAGGGGRWPTSSARGASNGNAANAAVDLATDLRLSLPRDGTAVCGGRAIPNAAADARVRGEDGGSASVGDIDIVAEASPCPAEPDAAKRSSRAQQRTANIVAERAVPIGNDVAAARELSKAGEDGSPARAGVAAAEIMPDWETPERLNAPGYPRRRADASVDALADGPCTPRAPDPPVTRAGPSSHAARDARSSILAPLDVNALGAVSADAKPLQDSRPVPGRGPSADRLFSVDPCGPHRSASRDASHVGVGLHGNMPLRDASRPLSTPERERERALAFLQSRRSCSTLCPHTLTAMDEETGPQRTPNCTNDSRGYARRGGSVVGPPVAAPRTSSVLFVRVLVNVFAPAPRAQHVAYAECAQTPLFQLELSPFIDVCSAGVRDIVSLLQERLHFLLPSRVRLDGCLQLCAADNTLAQTLLRSPVGNRSAYGRSASVWLSPDARLLDYVNAFAVKEALDAQAFVDQRCGGAGVTAGPLVLRWVLADALPEPLSYAAPPSTPPVSPVGPQERRQFFVNTSAANGLYSDMACAPSRLSANAHERTLGAGTAGDGDEHHPYYHHRSSERRRVTSRARESFAAPPSQPPYTRERLPDAHLRAQEGAWGGAPGNNPSLSDDDDDYYYDDDDEGSYDDDDCYDDDERQDVKLHRTGHSASSSRTAPRGAVMDEMRYDTDFIVECCEEENLYPRDAYCTRVPRSRGRSTSDRRQPPRGTRCVDAATSRMDSTRGRYPSPRAHSTRYDPAADTAGWVRGGGRAQAPLTFLFDSPYTR